MLKNNYVNTQSLRNNIPQASLTIALSLVIALIFRGTTSIFAAMIIPIILLLFMYSFRVIDYLFVSFVLILLTLIFITTQVVFIVIYTILGFSLRLLIKRDKQINIFLKIFIYYFIVIGSLFLGILLTEMVFSIPLHSFMLKISKNSALIYFLILSIESIIITLTHFFVFKKLNKYVTNRIN